MNAIFAVNAVDSFGNGKDMPWPHSKIDMKRFRDLTTGNTVLMGSGTWLSNMPKPLPNRRNCVLSSTLVDDRCEIYSSITNFMMNTPIDENVFVIGGAKVLQLMRIYITKVFLTRFKTTDNAVIKLDTKHYLDGYILESIQDFGDHTLEIYNKIV